MAFHLRLYGSGAKLMDVGVDAKLVDMGEVAVDCMIPFGSRGLATVAELWDDVTEKGLAREILCQLETAVGIRVDFWHCFLEPFDSSWRTEVAHVCG
jgi:hypothetical protein